MSIRLTILGCGSSGGVPRIGGLWGACDPHEPKNRRRRCSILVEKIALNGTTTVLIDTGPDMRAQLLDANVSHLDGVIYTHAHADHLHGVDDLRQVAFVMNEQIKVWADQPTQTELYERFNYTVHQKPNSDYPPIISLQPPIKQDDTASFSVNGAGGELIIHPIPVTHGNIKALGFKFEDIAYIPDVSDIEPTQLEALRGLRLFVIDALRYTPHPSHAHLDQALDWIDKIKPEHSILTNMHIDLDYQTLCNTLPQNVTPAFDGMVYTSN